jgi:hypothetical protein
MDEGTPKEVKKSVIDFDKWPELYKAYHDRIIGQIGALGRDLQVYEKDSLAAAESSWDLAIYTELNRFLELLDGVVRQLKEDRELLDFVRLLRNAHEGEERAKGQWK